MPWLSIIMAIISFFTAKKNGASTGASLAVAGLAGAGTYYASHNTEWGKANLLKYDGGVVPPVVAPGTATVAGPNGQIVPIPTPVSPATNAGSSGYAKMLDWAAPLAVGGIAGAAATSSRPSWVVPALLAIGVFLLIK